ncbi:MAG: hypothetical protein CL419_00980 [Acidimicrobiaceae bacterium]|nr:hypothetical protein [Acidimicrobiaceae bacterium]
MDRMYYLIHTSTQSMRNPPDRKRNPAVMDIPALLNEVTPQWLTDALGHTVTSVAVDQIGKGEGFTGQVARLDLTYDGATELPSSMIVKLPTADQDQIWIGQSLGVWEKEHQFYIHAASHISERIPRCYLNWADGEATRYVLLLEDLAPMATANQVEGATPDQARACVDALGKLHGHWYGDDRLTEWTWLGPPYNPALDLLPDLFEMSWAMATERYEGRVSAAAFEATRKFAPLCIDWHKNTYCTRPTTLIHGDYRLDNLLFGDDGSMAIIDWQAAAPNPGTTDLFFFILLNLTTDTRRDVEEDLFDLYLESLGATARSASGFDADELRGLYREALLFYTVTMASGVVHLDPSNERGAALIDQLVERTMAAADDHAAWTAHELG